MVGTEQEEEKVPMEIGEEIDMVTGFLYREEGGYTVHDEEGAQLCALPDSEYDDGEAIRTAALVLKVAVDVGRASYMSGFAAGREDEREKITYGFQAIFSGLRR